MDIQEVNYYLRRVRQRWDYIFAYCGIRNVDYDEFTMEQVKEVEHLRNVDKELDKLFVMRDEAQADYRKAVAQYLKEKK